MFKRVVILTVFLITNSFAVLHLDESFENSFPPSGWLIIDGGTQNGDSWEQTASKKRTGNYSATVQYGPQGVIQNEWLITPAIDLTNAINPKLIFYEDEEYWQSYGYHHYIKISTSSQSDTTTFVTILDMTPQNHNIPGFGGDSIEVDLSSYSGSTIYIAFVYVGEWADNWYIDDVKVKSQSNHDIGMVSILRPNPHEDSGIQFTPSVVIKNVGLNTESFPVTLEVESSGVVIHQEVVNINNLAPSSTDTVIFSPYSVNGIDALYLFTFYSSLGTDEEPSNDTISLLVNTYTTKRTPLLEMITNTGCPPCGPADDTLDHIMETYGDSIVCIRYHAWWPDNTDPFYQANIPENTARINYYGADYTPHLWINGTTDAQYLTSDWRNKILSEFSKYSPIELSLWGEYNPTTAQGQIISTVTAKGDPVWSNLKLRYAIVEDSIYYQGSNGTLWHNQTFRDMFPDVNGISLTLARGDTVVDTQNFIIDSSWDWQKCFVTVFIQDDTNHQVYQAGKLSLVQIVNVKESSKGYDSSTIQFIRPLSIVRNEILFAFNSPKTFNAEIEIYNSTGRRVFQLQKKLQAGYNEFSINTKTLRAPGVYFYRVKTERIFKGKFIYLVK